MTDELVDVVRLINKEEDALRKKKFDIMVTLNVVAWNDVQSKVISFLEEKRNVNS